MYFFFIGTTAELIKVAPVISAFEKKNIPFELIASNQNVLNFSELKHLLKKKSPDYTFKPRKAGGASTNIYLRFIIWFIKSVTNYYLYFRKRFKVASEKPTIIVHGDTVTSLVGAIISKLCGANLVHIESGLRSFNFLEPFPEEINRYIVSRLADVHFCPNKWSMKNLKGVGGKKVNTYENTVVESVKAALGDEQKLKLKGLNTSKYYILVVHRQEHTLFNKKDTKTIIDTLLSYANSNLKCVFIMHTLTKDYLEKQKMFASIAANKNIITPDRLSHKQFINLMDKAEFIATDGGTNQEEAYYLGNPCLILRKATERIEGLGDNALLSNNNIELINEFVNNYKSYKRRKYKLKTPPSEIISRYLEHGIDGNKK
jgi:UDP-N-acetylglucosamine 2-epimerase (non-hydrolysing)